MWLWLALSTAFLYGISTVLSKKLLLKTDERVVGWGAILFSLPWLFLGVLWSEWPTLSAPFWGLMVVMIPLEVTSYLCYLRAIRISPLSLTVPFLALTPLVTVLTSWLFLGERVSSLGLVGVATVTVGAYVLQAELVPQGVLEPIKAMFRVPGIRLMMVAALIYSVTSVLGKRAIQLSSPEAFPMIYFSLEALALTILARRGAQQSGGLIRALKPQLGLFLLTGMVLGGMLITHCLGIAQAPVAYFISVKRLSLFIPVLFGGLLFREEGFRHRIIGTALMLVGVCFITLT